MSEPRSESLDRVLVLAEELLVVGSPHGQERQLCDRLERNLRERSPHVLVRAENSLLIVPRALRSGVPCLMLAGHLDTVPELTDNPVRRAGDKLFGLGASDMKAADAVILWAIEKAVEEEPRRDLVCVLYSREEGPFADSELPRLRDAARGPFERADLAICMEPTDNRIELGCLGTSHASVTFAGRRAHSARPWQGENAIHKVAGLLQRLAAFGSPEHQFHGLVFREAMSATGIDFRGARNVVPDRCTVNVNYRFAPGKDEARVRGEIDRVVAGEAEWELTDFCPSGKVCDDNPLLAELESLLPSVEVTAKQAWTDVGRLSDWGIEAINWGPGSTGQAHQAGEWVSIPEIEKSVTTLQRWLWG